VEQAAEDDNDASLERRLVSIVEIICANIVSRKVDNNVPGPEIPILCAMPVRAAQSAIPVYSVVVPLRQNRRISTNKRATYLDDKQDNGVLQVIFAGIGSLQNASLGSGTEGCGRGRGC
jgi:hypothetical protein